MMNINLNSKKTLYTLSRLVFASYMIIFIWIVIFKCGFVDDLKITHKYISSLTLYQRIINPAEIQSLIYRIQIGEYFHRSILEPFLNIVIFVPVGLYVTFFQNEKRIFNTYLISFAVSMALELIQLATMIGGFSFLDLVTNTIGGIIGYFVYKLIYNESRVKGLNIISVIVSIIAIPIAVFAIYNTAINIDFYIDIVLRRL